MMSIDRSRRVSQLGEIVSSSELAQNFRENAIPGFMRSVDASSYPEFLLERRKLMAAAIRRHFETL